jgi:hypothetical protein
MSTRPGNRSATVTRQVRAAGWRLSRKGARLRGASGVRSPIVRRLAPVAITSAAPEAESVSVQARLQTPPRRACPTSPEALKRRHERNDAAGGARARASAGGAGDAPPGERRSAE